mmetsp:Transcript_6462/g.27555  ORF Transcript_6462/g.27555 Transcript_6462/m.27555 type:complete len:244 (+) Transcript_6462:3252-3983(+)
MTSCETTVSTFPRPIRWINASLSLSRTSATTWPCKLRLDKFKTTCRTSASALSDSTPLFENTTTALAVCTLTLSRSPTIKRLPCRNTTDVPFISRCFNINESSRSIFSLPSVHSTTTTPPPSDSFAKIISRMNNRLFSLQPSITMWSFSTTMLLPSLSAFILNCTASTTSARTTEKYRIPTITSAPATARLPFVSGTTPELRIPVLIHVNVAHIASNTAIVVSMAWYANPPPTMSVTAPNSSA